MAVSSNSVTAELVSVSTDGTVCHWDITDLVEPQSVTSLYGFHSEHSLLGAAHLPGHHQNLLSHTVATDSSSNAASASQEPLNICAMAFGHAADVNAGSQSAAAAAAAVDKLTHSHSASAATGNTGVAQDILFGSGSGHLIRSPLPYKPGDPNIVKLNAHSGLVTALQPHPNRTNKYKNLVLTSSLDWSIKLWNLTNFSDPVFEFFASSYEYVCDVQWSPVHPAVFVTITSGGKIGFWNLCYSTTEPLDTFTLSKEQGEDATGVPAAASGGTDMLKRQHSHSATNLLDHSQQGAALNKIVFSKDGLFVLVGDSMGCLHLIKLHSAIAQPGPTDEARFEMALVTGAKSKAAVQAAAEAAAAAAAAESKLTISEFDEEEEDDYYREMQRNNSSVLSRQSSRVSPSGRSASINMMGGFSGLTRDLNDADTTASSAPARRGMGKRSSLHSVRELD